MPTLYYRITSLGRTAEQYDESNDGDSNML